MANNILKDLTILHLKYAGFLHKKYILKERNLEWKHDNGTNTWAVSNPFSIQCYILLLHFCRLTVLLSWVSCLLQPCTSPAVYPSELNEAVLEKLTIPQLVNKFHTFYITWRLIPAFTTDCCLPVSPVYALPNFLLKKYLNIIFLSMARSPKWSLSLIFPLLCISLLPRKCHMPCQSHSLWLNHLIICGVQ